MVKILKLSSGDEVVAEASFADQFVKLRNPLQMVFTGEGIALVPLSPGMKGENIEIDRNHVVYIVDAREDLTNEYNLKFGNIVRPNAGIQIAQ
jgi:hypothetical protein